MPTSIFSQTDRAALQALVNLRPLATLVVVGDAGPQVWMLPLEWVPGDTECPDRMRGHCSRQHPLAAYALSGKDVLAVFHGPNGYISPRWYVNGQRTRTVAPSWNYLNVEARGTLRLADDTNFVRHHLEALVTRAEASREQPWSMDDASPAFVDSAINRLVGFEIEVNNLAGTWFLSQQRTTADRTSLAEHLAREADGNARELAGWIVTGPV